MLTKLANIRSTKAQWQPAIQAVDDALPAEREEYLSFKKVLEGKARTGEPTVAGVRVLRIVQPSPTP
jgi:hypothetical protein